MAAFLAAIRWEIFRTRYPRLRAKQVEMALAGDKSMLIWLGKQMLGQTDSPTVAIQNNVVGGGEIHKVAPATVDEDLVQIGVSPFVFPEREIVGIISK